MHIVVYGLGIAPDERHLNVTLGGEQLGHCDFVEITSKIMVELKLRMGVGAVALRELVCYFFVSFCSGVYCGVWVLGNGC